MAEKLEWKTVKKKVKDLKPYEKNPRRMTKEQAEQLNKSISKFNLVEIPAINTDNVIVAGHMRINILKSLGRENEEIEVRVPNRKLNEKEFKEYLLRSNQNTGEFDYDILAGFDEDVLKDVGFENLIFDGNIDEFFEETKDEKEKKEEMIICPHCGKEFEKE